MNKQFSLILLYSLLFTFSSIIPVMAGPGGYTVEPATDDMIKGDPLETVQIEWWQVPPQILIISWILMFCPFLAFPAELLLFFKMFAYLGYRKIAQKNVLENPSRNTIYHFIKKTPGTDLSEISRETGVSGNTLRYHLTILKLTNKVTVLNTSRNTRYFENSGRYSAMEKNVLKYLHNKSTRILLQLLTENPGLTRVQLETAVGISGAGVTWQMNRLSNDGLLRIKKAGRTARYELNTEAIPFLEKYLPHYDDRSTRNAEN
ncbi:MAG: winged helix-turn-helix transcriptional regulator [Methanoregula sp.]|jgi:predicted transcriptional regulator